jgi:hypothetical protein
MGALFTPSLLDWLFGAGIGTNIGAAIVWVPIGALAGYTWSRTKYWPLHAIHLHLEGLHAKLDDHADLHATHSERLQRIEALLTPADDEPPASSPTAER